MGNMSLLYRYFVQKRKIYTCYTDNESSKDEDYNEKKRGGKLK